MGTVRGESITFRNRRDDSFCHLPFDECNVPQNRTQFAKCENHCVQTITTWMPAICVAVCQYILTELVLIQFLNDIMTAANVNAGWCDGQWTQHGEYATSHTSMLCLRLPAQCLPIYLNLSSPTHRPSSSVHRHLVSINSILIFSNCFAIFVLVHQIESQSSRVKPTKHSRRKKKNIIPFERAPYYYLFTLEFFFECRHFASNGAFCTRCNVMFNCLFQFHTHTHPHHFRRSSPQTKTKYFEILCSY